MLRRSLPGLIGLLLFAQQPQEWKRLEFLYESGVRDYRIGSYYDALDEFNHIVKYPQSPFYLDALKYLAKTYLQIGKRTGEKRYLWRARNFLNRYLAKGGKRDSDYYYVKGHIFEVLGFYERSLANYKISLAKSTTRKERLQAVIGILRSAIWLKKLDMATRYMVILNIEDLAKEQQKEFEFLQGLYFFVKGEYVKAVEKLQKSYQRYESFLIENPEYYYVVAENTYRIGDLRFAKRLFRRIVTYVKNKSVLKKALLRLGDIYFLQDQMRQSANYYYQLIKEYPDTPHATIAKLKLLFLMQKEKKLEYYLKKFMPEADFLKDPELFVVRTLVLNRNNAVGLYALANFGTTVFWLQSPKLYERLEWELSLIFPSKLKYEHKEYFRRAWKDGLLQSVEPPYPCRLFQANPDFFFHIFDRKWLLEFATRLDGCKENFFRRFASRFRDDEAYLLLAQLLFEKQKYEEARKVLEKVKRRECRYRLLAAKLCFLEDGECRESFGEYLKFCGEDPFYADLFRSLLLGVSEAFIKERSSQVARRYRDDPVVRKFVRVSVERLLARRRYEEIIDLLTPLVRQVEDGCYLKSVLALSYVRIGKIGFAESVLRGLSGCEDPWYQIALNALENEKLESRILNVGEDR